MDQKYKQWEQLDKEMEEEEQAERDQKKKQAEARRAEAQAAGYTKPKDMEQAYAQAFDKNKDEMKISADEEHKFKKAFKDPKFRTLMDEYMEEISDPKHRAEQNEYIKQLENDGKTPEGKEFMQPKAGFAVKTKKDDKDKTKIFLNIVHNERVEDSTMKRSDKGAQWSLPYTLGPLRQEKDKGGALVPAIDCCYATSTLQRAEKDPRFKKMIVNTALDAVEKAFKTVQNQDVKLDRNYHIIKGANYKNGDPVTMMLNTAATKDNFPNATSEAEKAKKKQKAKADKDALKPEKTNPMAASADDLADDEAAFDARLDALQKEAIEEEEKKPKSIEELYGMLNIPKEEGAEGAAPEKPKKKTKPMKGGFIAKEIKKEEQKKKKKLAKKKKRDGPETPEYKLVERGAFDMAKFLQNDLLHFVSNKQRPKEIVAHITLPLLKSAATVELDVSERKLVVSDEKNYYNLSVALPHPVFEDQGSAKFDKVKKILTVTMPVQPLSKEEQDALKAEAAEIQKAQIAVTELSSTTALVEDVAGEEDVADAAVTANSDGTVGIPYTKEEKAERKKKLKEEEAKLFKSKVEEVDPEKEHGTWTERTKEPVLMRRTNKKERDEKQIQDRWVPHEDTSAQDEVQEAIAKAKAELKKHKIRQAEAKAKAVEDEQARQETDARMKRQAMKGAAMMVKKQQRKHLYAEAPAPAYVFKQNANTVTLIIKTAGVSEETLLFETPDDRTVSLVFSAFESSDDGDCEGVEKLYKLSFHSFAPIDTKNCTYKVASRNMVLVLAKAEKGETWDTLEGAMGSRLLPVIEPRMVFKQNASAATLLLQVAGVVEETVKVSFTETLVEIRFDGDIDGKDLDADSEDSLQDLGDGKRPYKLSFAPFASVLPENCRYNVASRNMVVVLTKQEEGIEWDQLKAKEDFIAASAFEGSKKGYVFKQDNQGLGYYVDVSAKAQLLAGLDAMTNDENSGATHNPASPTEAMQAKGGAIGFDQQKSAKESQGSIDAGSVTLVNQIMYELD